MTEPHVCRCDSCGRTVQGGAHTFQIEQGNVPAFKAGLCPACARDYRQGGLWLRFQGRCA